MISDTITSLRQNLDNAYAELAFRNAVIPSKKTVKNLVDSIRTVHTTSAIMVGPVSDIRYSIIDNVINVKWLDPDDVYLDGIFQIGFGGTRLVMKVGSYPQNENDGTVLVDNTQKNKYNLNPFTAVLPIYDDDVVYYFRFFSYNTTGVFNGKTQLDHQNRFNSESYSWDEVVENLHTYSVNADLLPKAGDVIGLEYMLSDYCFDSSGKKVNLNTRQLVYDNRDRLSTVTIPWVILGHNTNVPQYVQYRRMGENGYEDLFVQSVDDRLSSVRIYDKNGNSVLSGIEVGDGFQRRISSGCRTYTESWDLTANVHTYTDTLSAVQDVSEDTFAYANQGVNSGQAYHVPLAVTVAGKTYDFCGYTMTMQPVNCLASYGTSFVNTIQFDAPEQLTAYLFEKYPNADSDDRYFWLDGNGYHEIDWQGEGLYSNTIYQRNGHDIYKLAGSRMLLMTQYFQKDRMYFKFDVDGKTRIPYIDAPEFKLSTVYSSSNTVKSYGSLKTFYNNVPNEYVRYGGKTYKCIKSTTSATAVNIETQNPATLTAYFQEDASLSAQNWYSSGTPIPDDGFCGYCGTERSSYGCSLYAESFYRQYCNNTKGSMDAGYVAQSKFDSVSKSGLANANGLLLKLFKEQDFIRHVKTAANLTVISPINRGYRKRWTMSSSSAECTCDLFWPLGYYEVFGEGTKDGLATFAAVYPDNASRIKYYLTQAGTQSSSAANWWLRYPYSSIPTTEYNVSTSGASSYYHANTSYGFSPACLIS